MIDYYGKEEEDNFKQNNNHQHMQQQLDLSHFNQMLQPPSDLLLNNQLTDNSFSSYHCDSDSILNDNALIDWNNNSTEWETINQQVQQEQFPLYESESSGQHQILQDQGKSNTSRPSHVNVKEESVAEPKKPEKEKEKEWMMHQQQQQQQESQQQSNLTIMFEPINSTLQLQVKALTNNKVAELPSVKKQQKRNVNRRQQALAKPGTTTTTTNSVNSSSINDHKAGCSNGGDKKEDTNKIDHQRRFNELQARFRVNYARKSTTQNTSHTAKSVANTHKSKPSTLGIMNSEKTIDDQTNKLSPQIPVAQQRPTTTSSSVTSMPMNGIIVNTSNTIAKSGYENSTTHISVNTVNKRPISKEYSFSTSSTSSFPSRTMPIQIQRVSRPSLSSTASLTSSTTQDAEAHQKLLDKQLDKVDFDDITVAELKELLRQRGKPATGKKAALLQRLQVERELVKAGAKASAKSPNINVSSRVANRHSQPLPHSRSYNTNSNGSSDGNTSIQQQQQQRPLSFQGVLTTSSSIPVSIQNSNSNNSHPLQAGQSTGSNYAHPPISPGGQLYRSIANLHIESPPMNSSSSRRYSPYSPRLSSSPKTVYHLSPEHAYSSSVPTQSSLPNVSTGYQNTNDSSLNTTLSSSYSIAAGASAATTTRPINRFYNGHQKSYKPFTSSALATPDRDDDVNPFDAYYMNRTATSDSHQLSIEEKGEEAPAPALAGAPANFTNPIYATANLYHNDGFATAVGGHHRASLDINLNLSNNNNNLNDDMDWSEPAILDLLLQQGTINMSMAEMIGQPLYSDDVVLTNEQIMALLQSQQQAQPFEFNLQNTNFSPSQPLYQLQQQYLQNQQQQKH
ncbi:hypothetical protein BDF20DRAFT_836088 [Mycotypha africana]|uniref:uncharacterized protein n=1 Tax=Mycotypha africana TaxID=64632 RepID=UPI00230164F8|nr:uncharacterized protein BDF20DRAFT_836088 [Mycotypha africana]KAI8977266.1 hypothetical protein BDF20DRAFT_836088 [Mycotypha africana]